jgi:3-mercaptopyruvate sulfurtransferase SseA
VYFVARHLGYDARLYDGSIVDWSRRKLPVTQARD